MSACFLLLSLSHSFLQLRLTFAVSRDLLRALTTSSWCAISLMFLGRLWLFFVEGVAEVEFLFLFSSFDFLPSRELLSLSLFLLQRFSLSPSISPVLSLSAALTKHRSHLESETTHYLSTQGWAVTAAIVDFGERFDERRAIDRERKRKRTKLLLLLLCSVGACVRLRQRERNVCFCCSARDRERALEERARERERGKEKKERKVI